MPRKLNQPTYGKFCLLPYLFSISHTAVSRYGNIVGFYVGNEPTVIITDFEVIKTLLKQDEVAARPSLKHFEDIRPGTWTMDTENSGAWPGLMFSRGNYWEEQRRFTLRSLRDFGFGKLSMEDTLLDEVDKFYNYICSTADGQPIDINSSINISIVNALWFILVGEKLELSDPKLQKIVYMADCIARSPFPTSGIASMLPLPGMIRWPVISDLLLNLHDFKDGTSTLTEFVQPYIAEHQSSLNPDNTRDFLDAYLVECMKQESNVNSNFNGERGKYALLNIVIELLFAGMETTTSSLAWTIFYMLHHPEIGRKVQEEIDQVSQTNHSY